jgi:two-component system, LytTR family, response regulator
VGGDRREDARVTLRVAIVDDEEHARAAIRILLAKRPDVDVVAECRNGLEAVELLQWVSVDLLLLDVQMPGLDGFGVIHSLGAARTPPTVFVTAFDTYALRAFEVDAIDYVLKPFDEARFFGAFDRARRRIDERRAARWARRLMAATPERAGTAVPPALPRLPVPVGNRVVFVNFDEIDWIQAADQYVVLHVGPKEYLLRESLQRLAGRLPRSRFAHIHRSHVVNVARVREIARLRNGDAEVVLADGRRLRWSRRYRHDIGLSTG